MFHRINRSLMPIVLIIALVFPILGCDSSQEEAHSFLQTNDIQDQNGNQSGEPSSLFDIEVSFPNGAPPLDKIAEFKCTVKNYHAIPVKSMNLEINFPEAFELQSGNLSWIGDVPANSEVEVINASIKAIKMGNWTIDVNYGSNLEDDGFLGGQELYFPFYVSISEYSAQWRLNPSYDVSTPGPGEVGPSSDDGIDDLPQPPPTSTLTVNPMEEYHESSTPISVELSISELPILDKPVGLTCTVSSLYDAPNTTAEISLPNGVTLVGGKLEWQGDLKANKPKSFSTQIAFTDIGEWAIQCGASHMTNGGNSWGDLEVIYLTVGSDNNDSKFGWTPRTAKPKLAEQGDGELIVKSTGSGEIELLTKSRLISGEILDAEY